MFLVVVLSAERQQNRLDDHSIKAELYCEGARTAASEKVGLSISQVGSWSDLVASRLLARDIGLLKGKAAPNCSETLASGKFPGPFSSEFINACSAFSPQA